MRRAVARVPRVILPSAKARRGVGGEAAPLSAAPNEACSSPTLRSVRVPARISVPYLLSCPRIAPLGKARVWTLT